MSAGRGHPVVDPEFERAQLVLTPAELQAWLPYHRGMSQRSIAAWLGIDRSSVRDRLERARRKLALTAEAAP